MRRRRRDAACADPGLIAFNHQPPAAAVQIFLVCPTAPRTGRCDSATSARCTTAPAFRPGRPTASGSPSRAGTGSSGGPHVFVVATGGAAARGRSRPAPSRSGRRTAGASPSRRTPGGRSRHGPDGSGPRRRDRRRERRPRLVARRQPDRLREPGRAARPRSSSSAPTAATGGCSPATGSQVEPGLVAGRHADRFVSARRDGADIEVIAADGSGRRHLARRRRDAAPAWSPDGRRIAFDGATGSTWSAPTGAGGG